MKSIWIPLKCTKIVAQKQSVRKLIRKLIFEYYSNEYYSKNNFWSLIWKEFICYTRAIVIYSTSCIKYSVINLFIIYAYTLPLIGEAGGDGLGEPHSSVLISSSAGDCICSSIDG